MNLILNFKSGKSIIINNFATVIFCDGKKLDSIDNKILNYYMNNSMIFTTTDNNHILVAENALESIEIKN